MLEGFTDAEINVLYDAMEHMRDHADERHEFPLDFSEEEKEDIERLYSILYGECKKRRIF